MGEKFTNIRRNITRHHDKKFIGTTVYAFFQKKEVSVEIDGQVTEKESTLSWLREFKAVDTGAVLGGSVTDVLDEQFLKPIILKTSDDIQGLEFLFDYYGIRYDLLMEYNTATEVCKENQCLRTIYEALRDNDSEKEEQGILVCLDLFWPYVAKDCEVRPMKSLEKPTLADRYREKEVSKIQLKTLKNGSFCDIEHGAGLDYPLCKPIENPCPHAPLFTKDEIKLVEELSAHVLKVKIRDKIYCLKYDRKDPLSREIEFLSKAPMHSSLPHLVGVVDAGNGQVDQFVIPFVPGECLKWVQSCTKEQKERWKAQIADAVRALHKNGLLWGDVKPDNVMIEEGGDRAVLIDFGGDFNDSYIERRLRGTMDGDWQGVGKLQAFIDRLEEESP